MAIVAEANGVAYESLDFENIHKIKLATIAGLNNFH